MIKTLLRKVRHKPSSAVKLLLGILLTLCIVVPVVFAPLITPHDPIQVSLAEQLLPPGAPNHILGTDQLGRDLLSRLAAGGRVSLTVGVLAVVAAGMFGTVLGLAAGFYGGLADTLISRVVEVQLALPLLMLLLMIIAVFGQNLVVVALVLAVAQWPEIARLARSLVLVEREKTYVEAARAMGATGGRILFRHLVPNIIDPILTMAALLFAQAVLIESALSYLGLSVTRPHPTWGRILADGRTYITSAWWLVTIPGIVISALVLGINLLAEGARDLGSRSPDQA